MKNLDSFVQKEKIHKNGSNTLQNACFIEMNTAAILLLLCAVSVALVCRFLCAAATAAAAASIQKVSKSSETERERERWLTTSGECV